MFFWLSSLDFAVWVCSSYIVVLTSLFFNLCLKCRPNNWGARFLFPPNCDIIGHSFFSLKFVKKKRNLAPSYWGVLFEMILDSMFFSLYFSIHSAPRVTVIFNFIFYVFEVWSSWTFWLFGWSRRGDTCCFIIIISI